MALYQRATWNKSCVILPFRVRTATSFAHFSAMNVQVKYCPRIGCFMFVSVNLHSAHAVSSQYRTVSVSMTQQ